MQVAITITKTPSEHDPTLAVWTVTQEYENGDKDKASIVCGKYEPPPPIFQLIISGNKTWQETENDGCHIWRDIFSVKTYSEVVNAPTD